MKSARDIFQKNKPKKDFEISSHISLPNKYVFIQVSKAASSSIKWALQSLEFSGTVWNVQNVNNKFLSPHISPYQIDDNLLNEVFFSEAYRRISFVRNPYARILSCYLHRIVSKPESPSNKALIKLTGGKGGSDITFDEFVEAISIQKCSEQEAHWRCQAEDLCIEDIEYNFIGKVENIYSDIEDMLELLYGKKSVDWYKKSKKSNPTPIITNSADKILEYYKDYATVNRVITRYEQDFLSFNYDINIR